jgi:hypothetical protein
VALPAGLRLPQDADNLLGRMMRLLHDGFPFVIRKPSHPQWPSSQGPNHTTAGTWTRVVEPQKTGTIPIQFNNTAYQGPVTKIIKVMSNDKTHPVIDLQLKVNVWRAISVSPQNAIFNLAPDATENATRVLTIHNNTEQLMTLAKPELNTTNFTAQIITNDPGRDFQLVISAVLPLPAERTQGQVTLHTSLTNTPTLSLMALAIMQKPLTVSPAQITLAPVSTGQYLTSAITIQNNCTAALKLSDPTVNYTPSPGSDPIGIDLKEPVPGRQFSVMLIFPKGFDLNTNTDLELSIKTSNPQLKMIKVPIKKLAGR